METQKAGIVIDSWKLSIFDRHLKQSGYKYENKGAFTPDTLILRVDTTNVEALKEVLKAASNEAALTGKPK